MVGYNKEKYNVVPNAWEYIRKDIMEPQFCSKISGKNRGMGTGERIMCETRKNDEFVGLGNKNLYSAQWLSREVNQQLSRQREKGDALTKFC